MKFGIELEQEWEFSYSCYLDLLVPQRQAASWWYSVVEAFWRQAEAQCIQGNIWSPVFHILFCNFLLFRRKSPTLACTNALPETLPARGASPSKWRWLVRELSCFRALPSNYFFRVSPVPLTLDESKFKKKVFAKEGEEVILGCPVSGYPAPKIVWIIDGSILQPGTEMRGVKLLDDDKQTVSRNVCGVRHW